jgi:molybdopterin converting factor small subunit
MPHIEFTSQLAQHVDCPPGQEIDADTLGEALDSLFEQYPRLRDYVLDAEGAIRQHIAVFVDGEMLRQRESLDVPLADRSEVFVMQALSGG